MMHRLCPARINDASIIDASTMHQNGSKIIDSDHDASKIIDSNHDASKRIDLDHDASKRIDLDHDPKKWIDYIYNWFRT